METSAVAREAPQPGSQTKPEARNSAIEFIRIIVLVCSGALMIAGFAYGIFFYAVPS